MRRRRGSPLFPYTTLFRSNIDFGVGTSSAKVGFAATGQSAADFWNLYSRDDGSGGYRTFGAANNLKWADGTVARKSTPVSSSHRCRQYAVAGPKYNDYLYP